MKIAAVADTKPTPHRRTCGFRFSATDAAVIATGAVATFLLYPLLGELVWLFPIVLLHYFLFCNVFRIRRPPELIWAATFVLNFGLVWGVLNRPLWLVLLIQLPITFFLIALETRKPYYHGVLCRRLNPHLPRYLNGNF